MRTALGKIVVMLLVLSGTLMLAARAVADDPGPCCECSCGNHNNVAAGGAAGNGGFICFTPESGVSTEEECQTACTSIGCVGMLTGSTCSQPLGCALIDPLTLLQQVPTTPAPALQPIGMMVAALAAAFAGAWSLLRRRHRVS